MMLRRRLEEVATVVSVDRVHAEIASLALVGMERGAKAAPATAVMLVAPEEIVVATDLAAVSTVESVVRVQDVLASTTVVRAESGHLDMPTDLRERVRKLVHGLIVVLTSVVLVHVGLQMIALAGIVVVEMIVSVVVMSDLKGIDLSGLNAASLAIGSEP